eukprot:TRINITY_DN3490_c0_g2_i3.p1 TRINITY_DN3490_c0_g2~~TRINITY_DN3490_c0_g2_i3.p1  ORF type:complete len:413 (+),score=63.19 TRINITY_DN3490_c0_g2_i3:170-1408(+)
MCIRDRSFHLTSPCELARQNAMAMLHAISTSENDTAWAAHADGSTAKLVCSALEADSTLEHQVLSVLRKLGVHESARAIMADNRAVIDCLCKALRNSDSSEDGFILVALLSCQSVVAARLATDQEAVHTLVARACAECQDPNLGTKSSVQAIANLTTQSPALCGLVVDAGVLEPTMEAMGQSETSDQAILVLLTNLLKFDKNISSIVDADAAPKVAQALEHSSSTVRAMAVLVVNHLSVHAYARGALSSCTVVQALVRLLATPASASHHVEALSALQNLCLHAANHDAFIANEGPVMLEHLLQWSPPGMAAPQKLQSHCALFVASLSMMSRPHELPSALWSDKSLLALKSHMQSTNAAVSLHASMAVQNLAFYPDVCQKMQAFGIATVAHNMEKSQNIVLSQVAGRLANTLT